MKLRHIVLTTALASLTLAGCATAPRAGYGQAQAPGTSGVRCYDCGRIERIETVYGARQNSGGGAVIGAIIGGVLGNQVGDGRGRTAATVAGAAVGGAVGNNVDGRRNEQTFDVYLRMDDGRRVVVNQRQMGNLREGDYVRVTNGNIVLIR